MGVFEVRMGSEWASIQWRRETTQESNKLAKRQPTIQPTNQPTNQSTNQPTNQANGKDSQFETSLQPYTIQKPQKIDV